MIKRFQIVGGAMQATEASDAPVYVYISPDAAEREDLRTAFELDEHTLSSTLDPDEVSRVEAYQEHLLLIWKRPTNYSGEDSFFFDVASIGLLLSHNRLAMISSDEVELPRLGQRQAPVLATPMDVLLWQLFGSIHHYLGHLKVIKMIARDLQLKINMSMENKHLIQMFNLSESLVYYLNAINGNGVVLTRLRSYAEKHGMSAEILSFIDDLIIENNQCFKQAEIYSTVFSGLMDARGTLVNNNMNILLKNLTIINIVFLPLNLIASILGMSEFTLMTERIPWWISYPLFCAAMLVIGWATAQVLKRMGPEERAPRRRKRKSDS